MYPILVQRLKVLFVAVPIALTIGMVTRDASAATLQFHLSEEFSGATQPEGVAPWLVATFADHGSGEVRLTIDDSGLSGCEWVSGLYFNVNPTVELNALSFAFFANPTDMILADITVGTDAFRADGNGKYDVLLDLPPPGANQFAAGESVVVDISLVGGGVAATDFWYSSKEGGGNGTWITAAHVQGIGEDGAESGWIGSRALVPEPSVVISLLVAGVLLAALRNRSQ